MERPSPAIKALLDFAGTLIFSRTFSSAGDSIDIVDIGSTSLTDEVFSSFFLR